MIEKFLLEIWPYWVELWGPHVAGPALLIITTILLMMFLIKGSK